MTVPTAEERCAEIRQMVADRGWTDEITLRAEIIVWAAMATVNSTSTDEDR